MSMGYLLLFHFYLLLSCLQLNNPVIFDMKNIIVKTM